MRETYYRRVGRKQTCGLTRETKKSCHIAENDGFGDERGDDGIKDDVQEQRSCLGTIESSIIRKIDREHDELMMPEDRQAKADEQNVQERAGRGVGGGKRKGEGASECPAQRSL